MQGGHVVEDVEVGILATGRLMVGAPPLTSSVEGMTPVAASLTPS